MAETNPDLSSIKPFNTGDLGRSGWGPDAVQRRQDEAAAPKAREALQTFLEKGSDNSAEIGKIVELINSVDLEKARALQGVIEAATPRFDSLPEEQKSQLMDSMKAAEKSSNSGEPTRTTEERQQAIEGDLQAAPAARQALENFVNPPPNTNSQPKPYS